MCDWRWKMEESERMRVGSEPNATLCHDVANALGCSFSGIKIWDRADDT